MDAPSAVGVQVQCAGTCVVEGICVSGFEAADAVGVRIVGGASATVRGSVVRDGRTRTVSGRVRGIAVEGGGQAFVVGNTVHGLAGRTFATSGGASTGIEITGCGDGPSVVDGNTVYDLNSGFDPGAPNRTSFAATGILAGCAGATVSGNVVHDLIAHGFPHAAFGVDVAAEGVVLERNIVAGLNEGRPEAAGYRVSAERARVRSTTVFLAPAGVRILPGGSAVVEDSIFFRPDGQIAVDNDAANRPPAAFVRHVLFDPTGTIQNATIGEAVGPGGPAVRRRRRPQLRARPGLPRHRRRPAGRRVPARRGRRRVRAGAVIPAGARKAARPPA